MFSRLSAPISVCLCLIAFVSPVSAQAVDFAELEKTIESELATAKTPGAAVAIVTDDKIVFTKGFGKTNAEDNANLTPDTFSKCFDDKNVYRRALRNLADAGKIKLDAPFGNYLKNLSPKAQN